MHVLVVIVSIKETFQCVIHTIFRLNHLRNITYADKNDWWNEKKREKEMTYIL